MRSSQADSAGRRRPDVLRSLLLGLTLFFCAASLYLCYRAIRVMERAVTVMENVDAKLDREVILVPILVVAALWIWYRFFR